jgi:hypothetical protein
MPVGTPNFFDQFDEPAPPKLGRANFFDQFDPPPNRFDAAFGQFAPKLLSDADVGLEAPKLGAGPSAAYPVQYQQQTASLPVCV